MRGASFPVNFLGPKSWFNPAVGRDEYISAVEISHGEKKVVLSDLNGRVSDTYCYIPRASLRRVSELSIRIQVGQFPERYSSPPSYTICIDHRGKAKYVPNNSEHTSRLVELKIKIPSNLGSNRMFKILSSEENPGNIIAFFIVV